MTLPCPEQFSGCLIGQCLGDATGCRVEGYAPEACQNYVKYELGIKQPGDRDRFPTAIAVGGDVDTTAATTGAMSGAYLGLAAIPQELGSRLNDRGSWRYAELVELANKCYQLKNTDS